MEKLVLAWMATPTIQDRKYISNKHYTTSLFVSSSLLKEVTKVTWIVRSKAKVK